MSSLLQKILRIVLKVTLWVLVIYLVLGFIIIPLALTWAVRTQGVKCISHNVHAKSIWLNPLTLTLSVNGLEVMDRDNKEVMVELNKLFINVSFLSLFKKIYRVEDATIDGLKLRAVLLPDGNINLSHLAPQQTSNQGTSDRKAEPKAAAPAASQRKELPHVVVDKILLSNSDVYFTDLTVAPNFKTSLNHINILILGLTTDPSSVVNIAVNALLDEKGKVALQAQVKPFVVPIALETSFDLDQYAMTVLSPYVGKYTGRQLARGQMDFKMNYQIADNKLTASHQLLIQHFAFGNKVESKDALGLPFGLAVALLEDPRGRIVISLPVKGDLSDPKFEYWPLVGKVVRNFFMKIVTKPFAVLVSVVGGDSGTEENGSVRFIPGKAEVSAEDQEKLKKIVAGLKERPKLSLEINGSYDPQADWKAIKTEVFQKNFTDLKKESTRLEGWVYRELYERRFGIRALWRLCNQFQSKAKPDENPELNAEIKRQLIEDSSPDQVALDVLAQGRAKMIYDYILATGFDQSRLAIGANRATQSSMGLIPLEFTLTVYGEPAPPLPSESSAVISPVQP